MTIPHNLIYTSWPLDQLFDSITPNTPLFFTIYTHVLCKHAHTIHHNNDPITHFLPIFMYCKSLIIKRICRYIYNTARVIYFSYHATTHEHIILYSLWAFYGFLYRDDTYSKELYSFLFV